jgi:hypothetical protein
MVMNLKLLLSWQRFLGVHPFEKGPIHELLTESDFKPLEPLDHNQMQLSDL